MLRRLTAKLQSVAAVPLRPNSHSDFSPSSARSVLCLVRSVLRSSAVTRRCKGQNRSDKEHSDMRETMIPKTRSECTHTPEHDNLPRCGIPMGSHGVEVRPGMPKPSEKGEETTDLTLNFGELCCLMARSVVRGGGSRRRLAENVEIVALSA